MKFCVDCQHHRVTYAYNLTNHHCYHPSALLEINMVTGTHRFVHCATMREDKMRCSQEAKYFLPNSSQPLMDIK